MEKLMTMSRSSYVADLPSVGVVIPCYGYAHWLEGCVRSVLSQEGIEPHVLVVDDCSPDETPEVARRLIEADPRVEYLRHAENKGLIETANDGLRWAESHDYTVLLSADDLLVPGALLRATSVMERDQRVGMVYGPIRYALVDQPLPEPTGKWRATKVWPGEEWIRLRCQRGYNTISSPEVVVRTEVQKLAGPYDPACTHASDLNMWLRIAAISHVGYVQGPTQAIYRTHADSMLRSAASPIKNLRELRKAYESFFAHSGDLLRRGDALEAMARRALAREAIWRASRMIDRGIKANDQGDPVDEMISFAFDVYPDAQRLREWRGFRLRRAIGAGRSGWFPPFVVSGAAHKLYRRFAWARLRYIGT
jgi:glycosyltransferase involved in cell wall biosynthesis